MFHEARHWLVGNFEQNTYAGYLAIARILVGYHFLDVGWRKVSRGFSLGESLPRQLAGAVNDPIGWHQDFILNVVIPNPVFFGNLVAFGELAIGIALLTGCLVRVASVFGAFHNFNILFAVAIPEGSGSQVALNRLYIFLHVVFVMASAGRSLGLDGWLKKKFPRWWLF